MKSNSWDSDWKHRHEYYVTMTHAPPSNDMLSERFQRDQGCVFSGTLAV
jgi:hypothetical protein